VRIAAADRNFEAFAELECGFAETGIFLVPCRKRAAAERERRIQYDRFVTLLHGVVVLIERNIFVGVESADLPIELHEAGIDVRVRREPDLLVEFREAVFLASPDCDRLAVNTAEQIRRRQAGRKLEMRNVAAVKGFVFAVAGGRKQAHRTQIIIDDAIVIFEAAE